MAFELHPRKTVLDLVAGTTGRLVAHLRHEDEIRLGCPLGDITDPFGGL